MYNCSSIIRSGKIGLDPDAIMPNVDTDTLFPPHIIEDGETPVVSPSIARSRARWPKQIRAYQVPRTRRLPWLRCSSRGCGWRLAQLDVKDGRTCIRFGGVYRFHQALTCPKCGKVRKFASVQI